MEIKEAFGILAAVCVAHKASLSEHQRIQEALKLVQENLFPALKLIKDEEKSE